MTAPENDNFYVYLLSNASLDIFSENTLALFRVKLHQDILVPRYENWGVALHALSCHNNIKPDRYIHENRYLFVDCDIINPQLNGRSSLGEYDISPFNVADNRRMEIRVKNPVYHPLNTDILQHIQISLRDSQYQNLKVKSGQPTVVILHFKKMGSRIREFAITMDSFDPNYADNQVDDFRCNFPLEMSMLNARELEVALLSIRYPLEYEEERIASGEGDFIRAYEITDPYKFSPETAFFYCTDKQLQVLVNEALNNPIERGLVPGPPVSLSKVGRPGSSKQEFLTEMVAALNKLKFADRVAEESTDITDDSRRLVWDMTLFEVIDRTKLHLQWVAAQEKEGLPVPGKEKPFDMQGYFNEGNRANAYAEFLVNNSLMKAKEKAEEMKRKMEAAQEYKKTSLRPRPKPQQPKSKPTLQKPQLSLTGKNLVEEARKEMDKIFQPLVSEWALKWLDTPVGKKILEANDKKQAAEKQKSRKRRQVSGESSGVVYMSWSDEEEDEPQQVEEQAEEVEEEQPEEVEEEQPEEVEEEQPEEVEEEQAAEVEEEEAAEVEEEEAAEVEEGEAEEVEEEEAEEVEEEEAGEVEEEEAGEVEEPQESEGVQGKSLQGKSLEEEGGIPPPKKQKIQVNAGPICHFSNFENKIIETQVYDSFLLEMPTHFALRLGLEPTLMKGDRTYTILVRGVTKGFANGIDFDANQPSTALLYTSMIDPSMVGGGQGNILKIFPLASQKFGQPYHLYESDNLEFHPLSQADLQNIEFGLRQGDGARLPLTGTCRKKNLSLTFLFRPQKKAGSKTTSYN